MGLVQLVTGGQSFSRLWRGGHALRNRADLEDAARKFQLNEVELWLAIYGANIGSMAASTHFEAWWTGKFEGVPFGLRTQRGHNDERGFDLLTVNYFMGLMYRNERPAVTVMENTGQLRGISYAQDFPQDGRGHTIWSRYEIPHFAEGQSLRESNGVLVTGRGRKYPIAAERP